MPKVAINTNGIKKHISSFTPESAISEFVWNAFDAEANTVNLKFNIEEVLGSCNELKISDDGLGIPSDQLKFKFRPYYDSRKIVNKNSSLPHGHNGYGRFTFCAFSPEAVWETVYSDEDENKFEYSITIKEDDLVNFIDSKPKKVTKKKLLGTSVTFKELSDINESYINSVILPYIKNEFAWFLVLYPAKKITFNEQIIDRGTLLEDKSVVIESEKRKSLLLMKWSLKYFMFNGVRSFIMNTLKFIIYPKIRNYLKKTHA